MELADGWLVGRSVGLLVCQFLLFNDAIWTEYVNFLFYRVYRAVLLGPSK